MPNTKAFRKIRQNSARWKHKKVEVFERLLKREQKEFVAQAQKTMNLMAKFPTNSALYHAQWLKQMEEFEKTIALIEAKIRAAGLCPIPTPYLMKHVVSMSIL